VRSGGPSDGGFSALLEDSYFSRFFAKFVEIIAISFATACSAYLIAHFVGPPPASGPTPAVVSVGSAAPSGETLKGETPKSEASKSVAATAAIEEPRPATRPVTDAPALKAAKSATPQPPAPKDVKTTASLPHTDKSAEALARAALANLDADRTMSTDALIRKVAPGPVVSAPAVDATPRPIDPPARTADVPPPPAAEVPTPPVAIDPLPLPPNAGAAPERAAPRAEPPVEEARGLFALPKRVLGLLRPGTPSLADEGPRRPPLPVGEERPD
jgi:hypothetical protein